MTPRERILAALNFQPVDRIPFVPLIEPFTLMDMPDEIKGERMGGGFDPLRAARAGKALGCDMILRHVGVTKDNRNAAPHLQSLGCFESPVKASLDFKEDTLIETISTPVGTISGRWRFTDRVGSIPHSVRHCVTNHEELEIFHYAVEHLAKDPPPLDTEEFFKIETAVGEDGLSTASISNSPLMFLIEMAWGLENTYFLLQDYPEEVEDILDKLHRSLINQVKAMADGPANVVIQYENTSSTLLSPTVFRKYCLPYQNEYARILADAGKIFLIHMCGKINAFKQDISEASFNGVIDIAPPPTGDFPLDTAAKSLPGKIVVGGIDPTTFISEDSGFVRSEVSGLIDRIKPFKGIMLGSADVTPRGARVENFRLIRELIDTRGTY
jgi:hypothetical protein